MERVPEPDDGDERSILLGWLAFHRNALEAKCEGLTAEQLVKRAAAPSTMSLLGLVRHLTEMERAYAVFQLAGAAELTMVYGEYSEEGPEWDFDVDETMVDESFANWERERSEFDALVANHASLDAPGPGRRRSVRWCLQKLIGEYARHNGHADLLRERIDGVVGE